MKRLLLYVTRDEYELPLFVTDSVEELAEYAGVTRATIDSKLCNVRHGKTKKSRYREVWIEDD